MLNAFLFRVGRLVTVSMSFLGWGCWHVSAHAALIERLISVDVEINDLSLEGKGQAYGQGLSADLIYTYMSGTIIAKAKSNIRNSIEAVSFHHPEFDDCKDKSRVSKEPQEAYAKCYDILSRWFATWVSRARYVNVVLDNCRIDGVPVLTKKYEESWWLAWVPSPHIRGIPWTYYTLISRIDSSNCRAVTQ
jgi:hypothetical protein